MAGRCAKAVKTLGPWFRVYVSILDDPKLARLTDAQYRFNSKMLALAKFYDGAVPCAVGDIAFRLRMPEGRVRDTLQVLVSAELLDFDGYFYRPHNWNERQFKSDSSTERVQEFRERSRNGDETLHETPPQRSMQQDSTVTVTAPETETETDAEAETDSETESSSLRSESSDAAQSDIPIPEFLDRRPRTKTNRLNGHRSDFQAFYDVFPSHIAPRAAEKAYVSALKRASPEIILAGAARYRDNPKRDPEFTKRPATWLNADCWLDENATGPPKEGPVEQLVDRWRKEHEAEKSGNKL